MLNVADTGRGIIDRPTRRTVVAETESGKQRKSGRFLGQLEFTDDSFLSSRAVCSSEKEKKVKKKEIGQNSILR
jgi:hypothetical protein